MSLTDRPDVRLSNRDIGRWVNILNGLVEDEQRIRNRRRSIAHELGFDVKHPLDVKVGDTIRTGGGDWYEVCSVRTVDEYGNTVVDDNEGYCGRHRLRRFSFGDANGAYSVELDSEEYPIMPNSVIVAVPEDSEEPF
jgi:hypothetical protein